jgi:hypothetical protein
MTWTILIGAPSRDAGARCASGAARMRGDATPQRRERSDPRTLHSGCRAPPPLPPADSSVHRALHSSAPQRRQRAQTMSFIFFSGRILITVRGFGSWSRGRRSRLLSPCSGFLVSRICWECWMTSSGCFERSERTDRFRRDDRAPAPSFLGFFSTPAAKFHGSRRVAQRALGASERLGGMQCGGEVDRCAQPGSASGRVGRQRGDRCLQAVFGHVPPRGSPAGRWQPERRADNQRRR